MSPPQKLHELVFAHDYPFLRTADGQVYSDRGDWPWHRYLDFAEQVTVVSRVRELPADASLEGLTPVHAPGVAYELLPSLSGPLIQLTHRPHARRRLRAVLSRADALIARLPSEIGMLAVSLAEKLRKPWGVEVVTCAWDSIWNYGTWQGKAYAPILWWQTRRVAGAPRTPSMRPSASFRAAIRPAGGASAARSSSFRRSTPRSSSGGWRESTTAPRRCA